MTTNPQLTTLAAARVCNTVYIAVQSTEKKSSSTFVFAAVILISNTKKHGFGYKDMDETIGPCQSDCPERIIRLLTPISRSTLSRLCRRLAGPR